MGPGTLAETAVRPTSGVIVAIRGSVVDARLDGRLPPIYSVLRARAGNEIVIKVLAQQEERMCAGSR